MLRLHPSAHLSRRAPAEHESDARGDAEGAAGVLPRRGHRPALRHDAQEVARTVAGGGAGDQGAGARRRLLPQVALLLQLLRGRLRPAVHPLLPDRVDQAARRPRALVRRRRLAGRARGHERHLPGLVLPLGPGHRQVPRGALDGARLRLRLPRPRRALPLRRPVAGLPPAARRDGRGHVDQLRRVGRLQRLHRRPLDHVLGLR